MNDIKYLGYRLTALALAGKITEEEACEMLDAAIREERRRELELEREINDGFWFV